jgi:hypothetical protein
MKTFKEEFKNRSLFIFASLYEDGRIGHKFIEAGSIHESHFIKRFTNACEVCKRFNKPIGKLFDELTAPLNISKHSFEIIDKEIYELDVKPYISNEELELFIQFYQIDLKKDVNENNLIVDFWMNIYKVTECIQYSPNDNENFY